MPEWLVDLRHETTHGAMPGLTVLRAAVQLGLSWLETHYWRQREEQQKEVGGDRLGQLLELYKCLKVYQVWGTDKMAEIQEQEDMWGHLDLLWGEVGSSCPALASLTVRQAVGQVKTEVVNLVREEEEAGVERLARCLVEEELLLPDREFLDSLEETREGREVVVPRQLQQIWSEFILLVDRGPGAVCLVDRLMERVGREEGEAGLLAGAWVVLLLEGMLGRGNKLLPVSPCRVEPGRLEAWLSLPNPVVAQLVPLLCQVAGLEEGRRRRLEQLLKAASQPPEVRGGRERVYRLQDLGEKGGVEEREETVGWVVDTRQSWERVRLGGWPGQDWQELWLEGEWQQKQGQEVEEEGPAFEIGAIDWTAASTHNRKGEGKGGGVTAEPAVPHFYSSGAKQQQTPWKRQRRC